MASEFDLVDIYRPRASMSGADSSCSSLESDTTPSTAWSQQNEDLPNDPLLDQSRDLPEKATLLPRQRQWLIFRLYRRARFLGFTVYRRIFCVIFIANAAAAGIFLSKRHRNHMWSTPLMLETSDAAAVNIMAAVLIRQDYIINILFKIAWFVPFAMPLRIRRSFAKIYEYGGFHSGAAVCATLWYSLFTYLLWKEFKGGRMWEISLKVSMYVVLVLLWAILITAFPKFRFRWHNIFEHVHRWSGWIIAALFWLQLDVLTKHIRRQTGPGSPGGKLTTRYAVWFHLISTFHLILPWLRLRRLPVQSGVLFPKAIRFHFKEKVSNCVVYRISTSPLGEWHSFACIPDQNGPGGSLIVANAGDWTQKAISSPRKYYYTRGIPTVGVLCMAQIFRRVVIVTTGSGIGPCLGTMMGIPKTSCRVLWSVPDPWHNFGEDICNSVMEIDSKAVIVDTAIEGRPDLVQMAYELYIESNAEAIFCISNRKLTRKLVYALEGRGVPTFGPIWDS